MSVQVKGSGTIGGLDEGLVVSGIVTSSTQINVGSNIKLGNAGVVTATSFVGSGANLTSLPAQATIANNADNRIITGGSGVNLNAEGNATFDGQTLKVDNTSANPQFHLTSAANGLCEVKFGDANDSTRGNIVYRNGTAGDALCFHGYNNTERLRIDSSGRLLVNTTTGFAGDNTMIIAGESPSGGTYDLYDGQLLITSTETSGAVDTGGVIQFYGHDGGSSRGFGSIRCLKENGTSGNHNAYMAFLLRVNGGNPTERLRINSYGQVGINTTVGGQLAIAMDSSNTNPLATGFIALSLKNTNTTDNTSVCMDFNNSVGGIVGRFGAQFKDTSDKDTDLYFATRADGGSLSERLRIDSSGIVQFKDNGGSYTNTVQSHSGEAGFITHYTARTTQGADLYRRMLDIASGGANPHGSSIRFLTSDDSTNPATCVERMRILNNGGVYIGNKTHNLRYPHSESPALLTVQNGARVTTTTNVFAAPKGGFCDHARYELEQKLISFSNSNLGICQAKNGQALTINENRGSWARYSDLPNYLLGHASTDNINNNNFTLTLYATMTVFLLRTNGWSAVDLTGWNLIESDTSISPAAQDTRLYVKTLAAGSYSNFDNNSAMYIFVL